MNQQFLKDVKDARKKKKLTQEEVAKSLGITRRAYISFENGDSNFRRGIDDSKYEKLCEILQIAKPTHEDFKEERDESIEMIKQDLQVMKRMLADLEKQLALLEEI